MPEMEEREELAKMIGEWNNNRLDLFEISQPDQNLEFHGVIRFYFEDHTEGNVATKCLRVCSNSPTREIVNMLSEKFRPDIKMWSSCYSLYEIHTNKERKLDLDEKPLMVQLSWNSNNREGRFVLKKEPDSLEESCNEREKGGVLQTFRRTLSRKGKKKEKPLSTGNMSEDESRSADLLWEAKEQSQILEALSGLPVRIQISGNAEEAFLSAVINDTNSSTVHFNLSPAYILYAVSRFVLQHQLNGSPPSTGNPHPVTSITSKMVAMTGKVIQRQQAMAGALAFWMANCSELLNFFKHDKDLNLLTQQSQLDLSHQVHTAYSFLLQCFHNELRKHLPTFLMDPEQHGTLPPGIEMVLNSLMNAMSLLRRCRVNPALSIQLFSQLFHFISAWLFNQLMDPESSTPGLRSHYWGSTLCQRLAPIDAWAERQGLELAADCHLGHIKQATTLLTMNKYSMQNAKDIQSTCFKLNSLQMRVLLTDYLYASNEPLIPPDLIDVVVRAAEASADNLIRGEGWDIHLEESFFLHLPFLLPEGGYSCNAMRGIPQGFYEFMEPICQKGLCSLAFQPESGGDWTVYFSEFAHSDQDTYLPAAHTQPEIETITLHKPLNSGMGISIVAAKAAGQDYLGIYIKSVVKGGPADVSGRLAAGDQLLRVDGHSLVGLSQERAAAIMMQTGPAVALQVAKFGASYHGLRGLLSGPTTKNTTEGGGGGDKLNSKRSMLYCGVNLGPSERPHEGSKSKKEQVMQRNRQLYRSNPNMTWDCCPEEGEESTDPDVKGNYSVSGSNLMCTDTYHREYLTLPNPKSKPVSERSRPQQTFRTFVSPSNGPSSAKRTLMRQAQSQEDVCMNSGGPLLDQNQNTRTQRDQILKQPLSLYSSFPIRSSVSAHDILSSHNEQDSCNSSAGVWRTPFKHQSAVTPSIQPKRIDIPITRAANPPLTTFQSSSARMGQTVKVSRPKQSPQYQESPTSATKKQPLPPILWQQHRSAASGEKAEKPQVSIPPTKHVSFKELPSQQKITSPRKQVCDPWKREAQEKLEKEQHVQAVELLEKEVQRLRAKERLTAEENDRLRRLNLEWQFQKRLQEVQSRGEEEEDEDLDMMVIQEKSSSGGGDNWEQKEGKKAEVNLFHEEDKAKIEQKAKLKYQMMTAEGNQDEKIRSVFAPERLSFRERQRLFTLESSA
ncbi:afadin [Nothobranchius furzeri]